MPSRTWMMSGGRIWWRPVTAVVVEAGRGGRNQRTWSRWRWGWNGRAKKAEVCAVSAAGHVLCIADCNLFALVSSQFDGLPYFGGYGTTMTPLLQQGINRLDLVPAWRLKRHSESRQELRHFKQSCWTVTRKGFARYKYIEIMAVQATGEKIHPDHVNCSGKKRRK